MKCTVLKAAAKVKIQFLRYLKYFNNNVRVLYEVYYFKLAKKFKVEKVLLPTSAPYKLIHSSQKEQTSDIVKIMILISVP